MPSRFTRFGNLLEMCVLALNGATAVGLPLSLQIVCRGYDETMACASVMPISRPPIGICRRHRPDRAPRQLNGP
jgi:hypothetical protein